jgi:hypothetical protein
VGPVDDANPFAAPESPRVVDPAAVLWIDRSRLALLVSTVPVGVLSGVGMAGSLWATGQTTDVDAVGLLIMLALVCALGLLMTPIGLITWYGLGVRAPWAWVASMFLATLYMVVFPPTGIVLLVGMLDGRVQRELNSGLRRF